MKCDGLLLRAMVRHRAATAFGLTHAADGESCL